MATDREMLDRIAKLSSAIQQQRNMSHRQRGGFIPRGGFTPRGGFAPRGRGTHMSLNNKTSYPNKSLVNKPPVNKTLINPSHHKTLINTTQPNRSHQPPVVDSTVQPPSNHSHHRTWTLNNNNSNTKTITKSVDAVTGRKQVSIDGVDFIVKGKKLIRKDLVDTNSTPVPYTNAPKVLIRRTMKRDKLNPVIGTRPIRKHKGNMIYTRQPEGYVRHGPSSLVLKKALQPKKKRACGFFTRYGKCPNATRCPFLHDPHRRAICPRFLKQRSCTKPNCRLSHTPNHHIMPHCVHFQRGNCTSPDCIYPHVRVSSDAAVCKAFATEGYCPRGLECDEKHLHVCPEFAETGKCSNANCRLPHVAKSKKQSGIIKLGSWMNPQYFYAQQAAKKEKRQQQQQLQEQQQQQQQEQQEQQQRSTVENQQQQEQVEEDGFVRLFDDSDDDDGWSQFERSDEAEEDTLRFNEAEESDDEQDQFEDAQSSPDSSEEEEEVYEEVSDTEAMSEDEEDN